MADVGASLIADLNEVIRLSPETADFYAFRGGAYGEQGDIDRAFNDLNEAIRRDPPREVDE
jgi:hypothetical protein